MTIIYLRPAPAPRGTLIDAAIATHGPLPVLRAALAALLQRRPTGRQQTLAALPQHRPKGRHVMASNHLRRDLGLPPLDERPPGPFG